MSVSHYVTSWSTTASCADNLTAYVDGDVVTDTVKDLIKQGKFRDPLQSYGQSIDTYLGKGKDAILFAQCYLGAMGIAKAFSEGADIVLCGRVADASPCVGAAAWWVSLSLPTALLELARLPFDANNFEARLAPRPT